MLKKIVSLFLIILVSVITLIIGFNIVLFSLLIISFVIINNKAKKNISINFKKSI